MSTPSPVVRVAPDFEEEFPSASALATECFMNFGVVAGTVQSALSALLSLHGVPSLGAFNVLTVLDGEGAPLAPSEIAERMVVSRPTITGLLDTLERRLLIERRSHGSDGRMRLVALTTAGRKIVRQALPIVHSFEKDVLGCLDARQQRTLLSLLARLEEHLAGMVPQGQIGIRG